VYSLKCSGIDMPKKRATPVIKRFLIEFMLVNCKNDSHTEAEKNMTIIIRTYILRTMPFEFPFSLGIIL